MNIEKIPCYIMDLNTSAKVVFDVEMPETVNDSYVANFSDQVTQGRSSPFKAYSNSGPRTVSFTVVLSLDYRRDLNSVVNSLRAMLKPYKATVLTPPYVMVRIGDFLNIKAVPQSFDVVWKGGYKDSMYRICECTFQFSEVEDTGTFNTSKSNTSSLLETNINTSGNNVSSKKGSSNAVQYEVGSEYNLTETKKGFYTSAEALAGKSSGNPTGTCRPGKYWIYNKAKGMINITKVKGQMGNWINPN